MSCYLRRYKKEICDNLKLKHSKLQILEFITNWIQHTKKIPIYINNIPYYWFHFPTIADQLGLSYSSICKNINYLCELNLIHKEYKHGHENGKFENKMFISLNYSNYIKLLDDNDFNSKRITWIKKQIGGKPVLFDVDEVMNVKPKICKEADAIAKLILKKYPQYFSHRIPDDHSAPTKTYLNIVKSITDIYNGAFLKSRIYPLSDKFINNKSINIDGWRNKIKDASGNWFEVKKLILGALKNFVLMHDEDRMPYNKDYLQYNLSLWFYDPITVRGEPQSQFILCLFEPEYTNRHNSELKADKIFESLSETAKIGGNELFELNTSMASGKFWESVKKIVEWGKQVCHIEPNVGYWISSASELPGKFAEYCKNAKIQVSLSTLDIQKSVECNGPWTWFVKDASYKHNMNIKLAECVNTDDFVDCYNDQMNNINFDDMDEIPVF